MCKITFNKKRKVIDEIIRLTKDYAMCAQGWDMDREEDLTDWSSSIEEIIDQALS